MEAERRSIHRFGDALLDYGEEWRWEDIENHATVWNSVHCAWTDGSARRVQENGEVAAGSAVYVRKELMLTEDRLARKRAFLLSYLR